MSVSRSRSPSVGGVQGDAGRPPSAHAGSIHNDAELLKSLGNLDEARLLFEEALEGARETLGEAHPRTQIFKAVRPRATALLYAQRRKEKRLFENPETPSAARAGSQPSDVCAAVPPQSILSEPLAARAALRRPIEGLRSTAARHPCWPLRRVQGVGAQQRRRPRVLLHLTQSSASITQDEDKRRKEEEYKAILEAAERRRNPAKMAEYEEQVRRQTESSARPRPWKSLQPAVRR